MAEGNKIQALDLTKQDDAVADSTPSANMRFDNAEGKKLRLALSISVVS